MKVAKARYTGQMRTHNRRCPSGETVTFQQYPSDSVDDWTPIDDPEDARWLDDQTHIEVEWTPVGRLQAASDSAVAAISELGYTAKQQLVGTDGFDLDVAGNAAEDEIDDALREHVEQLQDNGEL